MSAVESQPAGEALLRGEARAVAHRQIVDAEYMREIGQRCRLPKVDEHLAALQPAHAGGGVACAVGPYDQGTLPETDEVLYLRHHGCSLAWMIRALGMRRDIGRHEQYVAKSTAVRRSSATQRVLQRAELQLCMSQDGAAVLFRQADGGESGGAFHVDDMGSGHFQGFCEHDADDQDVG